MRDAVLSRRGLLISGAAMIGGIAAGCSGGNGHSAKAAPTTSAAPTTTRPPQAVQIDSSPIGSASGLTQVDPNTVAAKYAARQPGQWGMDLDGIVTSFPSKGMQFALTFDACGGPDNDEINDELIDYLTAHQIPATLFLNKRWIDADPDRVVRLAGNPLFEIGNHGTRHCPLSVSGHAAYGIPGTASPQQAVDEVWGNHERIIQLLGKPPRFFRTGTAHYDEVAVSIVQDLGERPVGFSVNADAGATYTASQVVTAMADVQPGGISIAHMHRPRSGTAGGMESVLPKMRAAGYEFVHLP
ncbi:polysaccharide deacetylase family protein [Nocardia stercoris]|uniref:polysaccharide deacetylase family protein n=1 Tax=Nocardia stercoris TaxID=2483361 RepID=UPI001F3A40E0|nr:polysaccharide deacetylase family protein [Nocardia stercoris]